MDLSRIDVRFIDRLREAAKEHGAVADLLSAIQGGLLIDGLGNREIVADDDGIRLLMSAQIAAAFSDMDRGVE